MPSNLRPHQNRRPLAHRAIDLVHRGVGDADAAVGPILAREFQPEEGVFRRFDRLPVDVDGAAGIAAARRRLGAVALVGVVDVDRLAEAALRLLVVDAVEAFGRASAAALALVAERRGAERDRCASRGRDRRAAGGAGAG